MENMYRVYLVLFTGLGAVPSSLASETGKYKETNFSIVDELIQPAKFLADLSHSNNTDNSTLQKITEDLLKMINPTNSSRNLDHVKSVPVVIGQDTESMFIYNDGTFEENFIKKKFVICLGFVVFVLSFFIVYRKACDSQSHPDLTLPTIHRVDTPPPPPYYLFAPPSYEESICGLIKQDTKTRNTIVSIDWPSISSITSTTTTTITTMTTTIYECNPKDSVNEKLM